MAIPDATVAHAAQQDQISALTAAAAQKVWTAQMGSDFDESWAQAAPQVLRVVQAGRLAAARSSVGYVQSVLDETGGDAPGVGRIDPEAFLSSAPDGRSMSTLLDQSVVVAKTAVGRGLSAPEALAQAGRWLTMVSLSAVTDTSRAVVSADIGQRTRIKGYVRMLNGPGCSRCAILAGRVYRWNRGFLRHPRCRCVHIPVTENVPGDWRTDPYAYFRSLDEAAQDSTFGKSEARAIRDGADIYRVVNVKTRGLASAGSLQAIKYGTPTRLTVDEIYRTAGTRANAIRMLKDEGYITGPQRAAGNILGQREGFGALGKGGNARAASQAVTQARVTGVRDPLNRYTMTAAERRLYDAKVRLDAAEQRGIWLNSVGANSADKFNQPTRVTQQQLAILRRNYANEIARARKSPAGSVRRLATLLGVAL